jgi:hypothetical protein
MRRELARTDRGNDLKFTKETSAPEAVAASFEGKRNPRDLFTGPDCLIAPAMQQATTGAVRRRSSKREAHPAVHRPSACSGVKALRNTSDAKAARRQAPLTFRSLDPFRALRGTGSQATG